MNCPCDIAAQPWRDRDTYWSPASFLGGLVIAAFGVLAVVAGLVPWVGWLVLGALGASTLAALAVQAHRGHRGLCLTRRAVWFGLAAPGAPVRVIVNSP